MNNFLERMKKYHKRIMSDTLVREVRDEIECYLFVEEDCFNARQSQAIADVFEGIMRGLTPLRVKQ